MSVVIGIVVSLICSAGWRGFLESSGELAMCSLRARLSGIAVAGSQLHSADFGDDGLDEIVHFYSLNNFRGQGWSQGLAVFSSGPEGPVLIAHSVVGAKGDRVLTMDEVNETGIHFMVKSYASDDPMCCPSLRGRTFYYLNDRRLVEGPR